MASGRDFTMTLEQRTRGILYLSKYFGRELSSQFIRRTGEECPAAGIPVLHSLSEGIFKPADSPYALCIWSRSAGGQDREVYPDTFLPRPDGSWQMLYSAKAGDLDAAINRSLFACLRDRQPVLVIMTSRPRTHPGGARYRLLGPALLDDFDAASRLFRIHGCQVDVARSLGAVASPEEMEYVDLRGGLILPFRLREPRARYAVSRDVRDRAFRQLVLSEYHHFCCVCKSRFLLRENDQELAEAEAAHIVPLPHHGPDDPRNGLSLCRRHHWAFDNGLFGLSSALEIRVSPVVSRARRERFDLEEYDGEALLSPANPLCQPDPLAVDWHRAHVFRVG